MGPDLHNQFEPATLPDLKIQLDPVFLKGTGLQITNGPGSPSQFDPVQWSRIDGSNNDPGGLAVQGQDWKQCI